MSTSLLSAYLAVLLAIVYATVVIVVTLFSGMISGFDLGYLAFKPEFYLPYWSTVASLFMPFLIDAVRNQDRMLKKIDMREAEGVEIYRNAGEFTARLAEVTVGADWIGTINFSPPAGSSKQLDRYFKKIHNYLNSLGPDSNVTFRSIAAIENERKALWIYNRAKIFNNNRSVSFSCITNISVSRLMCYHIVIKHGVSYVFFYPPIPLAGDMDAFLIINEKVANIMRNQFEEAWIRSTVVLAGGFFVKEGMDLPVNRGVNRHDAEFQAQYEQAIDADSMK